MKETVSVIASLLVFVSYTPYILDTIKDKTKPHIYSWLNGSIVVSILFGIQLTEGAGWGALVTMTAAVACFAISLFSLKNGFGYIKKVDTVLFLISIFTLGLWLAADQPAIAAALLVTAEVLGFIPTIRKAWHKPFEETLFTWSVNAFRHTLALFGLATFTFTTAVFPIVWASANFSFSLMLIFRRRHVSRIS